MGENTKIEWCDHTFNPVVGCNRVHTGCLNCYAHDYFRHWGIDAGKVRRKTTEANWKKPIKWNRQARVDRRVVEHLLITARQSPGDIAGILDLPLGLVDASLKRLTERGRAMEFVRFSSRPRGRHVAYQLSGDRWTWRRPRVFTGSLCDVFEGWKGPIVDAKGLEWFECQSCKEPDGTYFRTTCAPETQQRTWEHVCGERLFPLTMSDIRRDLFDQIDQCQNLDWLLLTKRPKYILPMWIPPHDGSVQCLVCQKIWANTEAYKCPDCGQDDSREMTHIISEHRKNVWLLYSASAQDTLEAGIGHLLECRDLTPTLGLSLEPLVGPIDLSKYLDKLDFVIVGGESGPNARPCDLAWILDIVQQCRAAGVSCFVKQAGSHVIDRRVTDATHYSESQCWPDGTRTDFHRVLLKHPKGGDPAEWPKEIRVQQIPEVKR